MSDGAKKLSNNYTGLKQIPMLASSFGKENKVFFIAKRLLSPIIDSLPGPGGYASLFCAVQDYFRLSDVRYFFTSEK